MDNQRLSLDTVTDYTHEEVQGLLCALMHDTSDLNVVACHSEGAVSLYDRATAKLLWFCSDLHAFEIWFCSFSKYHDGCFYTCSDDSKFKLIDFRDPESVLTVQTNKKHQAGVTCLQEISETKVITGSYDTTIKIWDLRKLNTQIEELQTGKQVWDIKFNKSKSLMTVACVYDGYLFIDINQGGAFTFEGASLHAYEAHESICYACEQVSPSSFVTSSFYDNQVRLISRN